jgi:hypothetical protein
MSAQPVAKADRSHKGCSAVGGKNHERLEDYDNQF